MLLRLVAQTHTAPFLLGPLPKDARPWPEILVGVCKRDPNLTLSSANMPQVTCADPRCDPAQFFAPKPQEMVVFRNAGGRVEAILPDILAIDVLMALKHIVVVHHTDCGATMLSEDDIRTELGKVPGSDPQAVEKLCLPNYTE